MWVAASHAEVRSCALDADTFSSRVSRHLQIPNGLDGEEHRRFRKLIDHFLSEERVTGYAPLFGRIAGELVSGLPKEHPVEIISSLGSRLAARAQCGWLGWAPELEESLLDWMRKHREAAKSRDLKRLAAGAARFDKLVLGELARHRGEPPQGGVWKDAMADLLRAKVEDPAAEGGERELTDKERVSVLRNWVAGDLGSIASSVGGIAQQLAARPEVQREVRRRLDDRAALARAIDELMRIDDPFVSNRRVTTRAVELNGRNIPAKARVLLHWTAANRDRAVFPDPDAFQPEANAKENLVYGIGPHVCPGRTLATLQLVEAIRALLVGCECLRLSEQPASRRAEPPAGGYEEVWVCLSSSPLGV